MEKAKTKEKKAKVAKNLREQETKTSLIATSKLDYKKKKAFKRANSWVGELFPCWDMEDFDGLEKDRSGRPISGGMKRDHLNPEL